MDRADVTQLLEAARAGDEAAADNLFPIVYQELRAAAASRLRRAAPGVTLQPTALVHEVFLRLVGRQPGDYENRGHFFFVAARAMHDILVERARRKAARKHGGEHRQVAVEHLDSAIAAPAEDMLALQDALARLEQLHPRQHRVVMLRFFTGLSESESAEAIGCDRRTAARDWRFARAWLHEHLTDAEGAGNA